MIDDATIIRQILNGDVDAFAQLLARHREHVLRIVAGRVPGDAVDEVAQDVFVQAYRSLERYQPTQPFAHWLARIAVRRCQDHWRRHYRHAGRALQAPGDAAQGWFDAVAADQAQERQEREDDRRAARESLDWALAHLSPEDREAVTLVHLEERSVSEAADLLGWSVSNVKVRLFRARQKLKQIITQTLNPRRP